MSGSAWLDPSCAAKTDIRRVSGEQHACENNPLRYVDPFGRRYNTGRVIGTGAPQLQEQALDLEVLSCLFGLLAENK